MSSQICVVPETGVTSLLSVSVLAITRRVAKRYYLFLAQPRCRSRVPQRRRDDRQTFMPTLGATETDAAVRLSALSLQPRRCAIDPQIHAAVGSIADRGEVREAGRWTRWRSGATDCCR